MARAPAMAILLSTGGMSMGNTCQLPLGIPIATPRWYPSHRCFRSLGGERHICFASFLVPLVRFSSLLHNLSLLCTGSAQALTHFKPFQVAAEATPGAQSK